MRWPRRRGRRRSRFEGVDFLQLRPRREVEFKLDEPLGQVTLLPPRFRSGWPARWLQPRLRPERRHVKIHLEKRGSWLWQQCDGLRSIGEMVAAFRVAFPEDHDQLEQRVCQYLYQMEVNGLIRFVNLEELAERSPAS
jgi:hypothetical protein